MTDQVLRYTLRTVKEIANGSELQQPGCRQSRTQHSWSRVQQSSRKSKRFRSPKTVRISFLSITYTQRSEHVRTVGDQRLTVLYGVVSSFTFAAFRPLATPPGSSKPRRHLAPASCLSHVTSVALTHTHKLSLRYLAQMRCIDDEPSCRTRWPPPTRGSCAAET